MRENTCRLFPSLSSLAITALFVTLSTSIVWAQSTPLPKNFSEAEASEDPAKPGVATPRVATGRDLYCAGYIRADETKSTMKIIGAEEENRLSRFGQGMVVYISTNGAQNVRPGALFAVTRPMGKFHSPYQRTGGKTLGTFVRELGVLRVMAVQGQTATARVTVSCEELQLGDILVPFAERSAPETDVSQPLPRYQPTSGRQPGRIVLQREMREQIGPRDVVYIDLGAENGVKAGDKFTIFRHKPDDGSVLRFDDDDIVIRQSGGYESDRFKGGKFSMGHPAEAREQVRKTRPAIPQKILGELVVIAVEGKAATAIVTRTTQEVHTGDRIESLQ